MQTTKFQFSEGFVRKLVELTEGSVTSAVFENVLSLLETEAEKFHFNSSSEANLLRIFSYIYDRRFFFEEITRYPHHGEIIAAISASSNYLSDIVVRNPEFLYQIFDQTYLSKKLEFSFLQKEISEGVARFKSLNAKLNFFRQVKKRFILKIGLADLLGIENLITTTEQLSSLAKAINANLFEVCLTEILHKYNLQNVEQKYCLCSLGKMGGTELNYSSDVDFVLFYDFNEQITGTNKEYHEILSEATQLFVKSSMEITDRGYIYRVDFRLRPDGKYSPLCKTLGDYIKYYETRGEDWERQMLIKLDYVGGDENLYRRFFSFVQAYVYPSTFSSSVKEKIKTMKQNIERQHDSKENVKTFWGGIRDIEFSVQALQLLNGGKIKSVRTGNSLKAINGLFTNKLLNRKEKEMFETAYIFYRRIEHFLQLMNDTQTHVIPNESEMIEKLANYLGVKSKDEFEKKLQFYRENVRKIYNQILATDKSAETQNLLEAVNYKDKLKAEKNIKFLRSGTGLIERKEFDSRTIELFNSIEILLTQYLSKSANPDRVLDNFVKIIRSTKFPSLWYNEFTDKKFFTNFLKVCTYSQKAIDLLSADKSLEEFYLSRKVFVKEPLDEIPDASINEIILLSSVQFSLGLINGKKVSNLLSAFIRQKVISIIDSFALSHKLIVGGLGSFGWNNMNFASDIDLLIIADEIENNSEIQNEILPVLERIRKNIRPFEIDFKLRPEGKKSQLVWDLRNYDEYLSKRARLWEFQSFLKLSFMCGETSLGNNFRKIIADRFAAFNKSNLKTDVLKMYKMILADSLHTDSKVFNVKKDYGGLLTLDFILQYLVLNENTPFTINFKFPQVLASLKKSFPSEDAATFKKNFVFLKELGVAIQNIFNVNNMIIPSETEKKLLIARFLKLNDVSELENRINETIKFNNKLFEKYVGK